MRPYLLSVVLVLRLCCLACSGSDVDDPMVDGKKLSVWIQEYQSATDPRQRNDLAFVIAKGKEKAKAAVPIFAKGLKDRVWDNRFHAAAALRMIGPSAKAAVPDLLGALNDSHPWVRWEVMYALASIGAEAKTVVPRLIEWLKDPANDSSERSIAAYCISRFMPAEPSTVEFLKKSLTEKEVRVRVAVACALYTLDPTTGKQVLPVFREGLKDSDSLVRVAAIRGLSDMGTSAKEAIPELIAQFAHRDMLRYFAGEVLGKIPEAEPALISALNDKNPDIRKGAEETLMNHFPNAAKKAGLIPQ